MRQNRIKASKSRTRKIPRFLKILTKIGIWQRFGINRKRSISQQIFSLRAPIQHQSNQKFQSNKKMTRKKLQINLFFVDQTELRRSLNDSNQTWLASPTPKQSHKKAIKRSTTTPKPTSLQKQSNDSTKSKMIQSSPENRFWKHSAYRRVWRNSEKKVNRQQLRKWNNCMTVFALNPLKWKI